MASDGKSFEEIILRVGNVYPSWKTGQSGLRLEWSETGFVLYVMLNGISPAEKQEFSVQKGFAVRYTVIGDVCFFTFRF